MIWTKDTWLYEAAHILGAIRQLGHNWDGNGAFPVNDVALLACWSLLCCLRRRPKPFINPARNGGVQIEWETEQFYLEVEISRLGSAEILFTDIQQSVEVINSLYLGEPLDIVEHYLDLMYESHILDT